MKSKTRKAAGKASLDPLVRRWFCGSLQDTRQRNGYCAQVLCLTGGRFERVAIVYGATLEAMRERKHAIVDMLNASTPNNAICVKPKEGK